MKPVIVADIQEYARTNVRDYVQVAAKSILHPPPSILAGRSIVALAQNL